jgi:hypothetical protein
MVSAGYHYVDGLTSENKVEPNAAALYGEFSKLPTATMARGEIYTYTKPHWKLLISRGDYLGIILSFSDQ